MKYIEMPHAIFIHSYFTSATSLYNKCKFQDEATTEPSVDDTMESFKAIIPKEETFKIMGLSPKDPQDWLTVFLSSVIIYNTLDIAQYWIKRLLGME